MSEPESYQADQNPDEELPSDPMAPPEEAPETPTPPDAEPGVYHYDGEEPTYHTVLGRIVPGENDFTGTTHPEILGALAAAVEAGWLTPTSSAKPPSDDQDMRGG